MDTIDLLLHMPGVIATLSCPAYLVVSKQYKLLANYVKLFAIGLFASNFPFLGAGMILGFESVSVAAAITTYVFRKELGE